MYTRKIFARFRLGVGGGGWARGLKPPHPSRLKSRGGCRKKEGGVEP